MESDVNRAMIEDELMQIRQRRYGEWITLRAGVEARGIAGLNDNRHYRHGFVAGYELAYADREPVTRWREAGKGPIFDNADKAIGHGTRTAHTEEALFDAQEAYRSQLRAAAQNDDTRDWVLVDDNLHPEVAKQLELEMHGEFEPEHQELVTALSDARTSYNEALMDDDSSGMERAGTVIEELSSQAVGAARDNAALLHNLKNFPDLQRQVWDAQGAEIDRTNWLLKQSSDAMERLREADARGEFDDFPSVDPESSALRQREWQEVAAQVADTAVTNPYLAHAANKAYPGVDLFKRAPVALHDTEVGESVTRLNEAHRSQSDAEREMEQLQAMDPRGAPTLSEPKPERAVEIDFGPDSDAARIWEAQTVNIKRAAAQESAKAEQAMRRNPEDAPRIAAALSRSVEGFDNDMRSARAEAKATFRTSIMAEHPDLSPSAQRAIANEAVEEVFVDPQEIRQLRRSAHRMEDQLDVGPERKREAQPSPSPAPGMA